MNQDFLEVRAGEKVTADKWNQMQKAAASTQVLRGGDNVRIQITPHGTLINSKHGGGWNNAWRVVASQRICTVAPGTVNGEYPSIKDPDGKVIRIDTKPRPHLSLEHPVFGPNGVGWIALELKLKEDYRTIESAMVVQADYIVASELATTNPFFFFGLPGIGNFKVRYPLARIHQVVEANPITGQPPVLDIFQVAMFNLNFSCKPPAQQSTDGKQAQSSLPRYFFWPA